MLFDDEYFMKEALKQAQMAMHEGEIPIGAVIVNQNKIIARAYNQVEKLNDVTAHAEMLAITSAANYTGGKFLQDCTLFVTLEPCVMCIGAIRHARIKKIVFGTFDNRHILPDRWKSILPNVEIANGVLEKDCQHILNVFFQSLRNSKA